MDFNESKNGYDKEQVDAYIERVAAEYTALYSEYSELDKKYSELKANPNLSTDIPQSKMNIIASAIIDAETKAHDIVDAARQKAWNIITDAKKGITSDETYEDVMSYIDLTHTDDEKEVLTSDNNETDYTSPQNDETPSAETPIIENTVESTEDEPEELFDDVINDEVLPIEETEKNEIEENDTDDSIDNLNSVNEILSLLINNQRDKKHKSDLSAEKSEIDDNSMATDNDYSGTAVKVKMPTAVTDGIDTSFDPNKFGGVIK